MPKSFSGNLRCSNENVECDLIRCKRRNSFEKSTLLNFDINFNFPLWAFEQKSQLSLITEYESSATNGTQNFRIFHQQSGKPFFDQILATPKWITLSSALVGTLVVLLVAYFLVQAGFFSRKIISDDETEESIAEKLVSSSDSPLPHIKVSKKIEIMKLNFRLMQISMPSSSSTVIRRFRRKRIKNKKLLKFNLSLTSPIRTL